MSNKNQNMREIFEALADARDREENVRSLKIRMSETDQNLNPHLKRALLKEKNVYVRMRRSIESIINELEKEASSMEDLKDLKNYRK